MTEQQACTLCGAGGHTAANCIWNGSEKGLALAQRIDKNLAERAQFESWVRREWPGAPLHHVRDALPVSDPRYGEYCNENIQRGWVGWQARAALAQPSPAPELAVLERWGSSYEAFSPDLVRQDTGRYVKFVDAERIVGALRAELAEAQETLNCANQHRTEWQNIALQAEQQRDAAKARVAELLAALERAATAMWNSEANMDIAAADAEEAIGNAKSGTLVAQAGQVLAGWRIEQAGDRIVVQQLPSGAGYAAAREGASGIAESVLFLLAADLLAGQAGQVPQAWFDVQAERRRQVEAEGFDASHDDMATKGQIARAAGCYALHAGGIGTDWPDGIRNGSALFWPWDKEWWKPKSARENLVRAGALILAEIERLDRAAVRFTGQHQTLTESEQTAASVNHQPAKGGRDE